MLAALLSLAPCAAPAAAPAAPAVPASVVDEEAAATALDAWGFVMEVLDRFASEPYGARIGGAHVPSRSPWGGPPLAAPELPPELAPQELGIDVRAVRVEARERGTFGVELELALRAASVAEATLLLEHVFAHLGAQAEVLELERETTRPLAEGAGLLAGGVRFTLDLAERGSGRGAADERFWSVELAIRALAAREGPRIAPVAVSTLGRVGPDGTEGFLGLAPAEEGGTAEPAALYRWLRAVEASDPWLAVRELALVPPQATPASGWQWSVTLQSTRAAEASPPRAPRTSVIAGLEWFGALLAGFRADPYGVALSGALPSAGPRGAAALGLDPDDVEHLATLAGFAIEVHRLQAASRQAGGVTVVADLVFRSEYGVVEATRLYELFLAAAVSQPELGDLPLLAAQELPDGSGVLVRNLGMDLALPGRAPPAGSPDVAPNPLSLVRGAAARDGSGLGSVSIDVNERRGVTMLRVKPRAAAEAGRVLELAAVLEREGPGYTVTEFELEPAVKRAPGAAPPGVWAWSLLVEIGELR